MSNEKEEQQIDNKVGENGNKNDVKASSNGDAVDITEKEKKIIKQIEYYFSDINMARDAFMKNAITEDDGWITMETMLKFNRLKALSDDAEEILTALEKSTNDLIHISADRKKIRRNPNEPIPESLKEATNQYLDRTVYVKGFASEDTLDDILQFVEQAGPTVNIHMRRLKDKKFKGSVFAIFKLKEDAEKFLTMEETKSYKDKDLIRSWQSEYFKRKNEEREASKAERRKRQEEADASRDAAMLELMTLGAILELSGFPKSGPKEKVDDRDSYAANKEDRETVRKLKEWLSKELGDVAEIAWVDFDSVEGNAFVRFHKENTAALAMEKLGNAIKFENVELNARVLTGDDEKQRWKIILAERKKKMKGGRGGGRDRKFGGRHKNEPQGKRIKLGD